MITLRQNILRGDLRALYLAWLKAISVEDGESLEEQVEPPVPANLQTLSRPLKSFVKLFEIDEDLIAVASENSLNRDDAFGPELEKAIASLSEQERIDFLVRLARGEPNVDAQLVGRLREFTVRNLERDEQSVAGRRRVSELFAAAEGRVKRREEWQRREAEKARIRKLQELSQKEPELWEEVFALIEKKQAKAYDGAVKLLIEVRELAEYLGQPERFKTRVDQICKDYRNRPALISRLSQANLIRADN